MKNFYTISLATNYHAQFSNFILVACVFFSVCNLDAQVTSTFENNVLTLQNGIIKRVITLSSDGRLSTSSFKLVESDEEFILGSANGTDESIVTGSDEFAFLLNGIQFTGLNKWEYISHEDLEQGIKLNLKSTEAAIEIGLFYAIYPDLPLIRKKIEIKNTGQNELKIENLDIESLKISNGGVGTSSWIMNNYGRQKHLGQFVGNWYDPLVIVHNHKTRKGLFLGNEAPGVMKRTTAFIQQNLLTIGLTHNDQNFGFRKWIQPDTSWESTWIFTGLYDNSDNPGDILNTAVNDYVRKWLGARIFQVKEMPTFVYNTWAPFGHNIDEELMYELIDAVAECGAQEFIIDDGWQDSYGDWGVNKEKFPNGLKPIFDYIKSKGMKPGVWISLASAETSSKVYKEHPEWTVKSANGEDISLHSDQDNMYGWETKSMCLTTGWRDYIKDIILKMVDEFGLEYVKGDFAAVTGAYTSDKTRSGCHARNHEHKDRNESMLEMYEATWQLFDELHEAAPNLFIDCTFETMGALHLIDLAMCKHADGNWLSNFYDKAPLGALKVRNLAWSRTPTIPAASMVIGNQGLDDPNFLFSMKSLAGTLPIVLGDPRNLSPEKRTEIKEMATWLKEMQDAHNYMTYRQDLPGFGEPQEGFWDGFQRINTDTKSGGLIGIFKQSSYVNERWVTINYLDPSSDYEVLIAPSGKVITQASGEELRTDGFKVILDKKNFQGELFEVRKVRS